MEKSYLINANTILEKDYFCVIPKNGTTEVGWYQNSIVSQYPPPDVPLNMEYSFDKTTWHKYTRDTDITITEPIYFRGNNNSFISVGSNSDHFIYLKVNNTVDLAGRLNSLSKKWSYTGSATEMPLIHSDSGSLFKNNSYIRSVANLRLNWNITETNTVTAQYKTYAEMFKGCVNLIDSPKFECVTTYYDQLYSEPMFGEMFSGCTSLVTAPNLSSIAITPECYRLMFQGCTSLTTPPSLPSINLAEKCYQSMFSGCIALEALPALPATVLPAKCYERMFYDTGTSYNNGLISTTQDSTYTNEFEIIATSAASDSLNQMFSWYYDDYTRGVQPVINTTYYCKIPTLSE